MQADYIRRVRQLLRVQHGLDDPEPIPDWSYAGNWFGHDLFEHLYEAYEEHHVLPVAGGYLDQPPEWWEAYYVRRALEATLLDELRPEIEAKRKPHA